MSNFREIERKYAAGKKIIYVGVSDFSPACLPYPKAITVTLFGVKFWGTPMTMRAYGSKLILPTEDMAAIPKAWLPK
ncbi:hypothetical protein INT44_004133 [Umbelopsis vinacea]|uniref:Uncharacterized protein n=1 Tax=Umbelopsis vinacea TaxID=44442 RepID=A0A8H7UK58_9FUNG|nr:hypothetical protein INT44_004133 [Umbelopsis vinacea]